MSKTIKSRRQQGATKAEHFKVRLEKINMMCWRSKTKVNNKVNLSRKKEKRLSKPLLSIPAVAAFKKKSVYA